MKKTGSALIAAICFMQSAAMAEDVFLCMRTKENVAIASDENGYFEYINMVDSNGVKVTPILAGDGNTYLPLRFICEKAGIGDGNAVEGELPDGYFRYRGYGSEGVPEIEIKYNGQYYHHNVNEPFTYSSSEGDRAVAIYNVEGTLYAPMRYIAEMAGLSVYWCGSDSQIMLMSKSLNYDEYLGDGNRLNQAKRMHLGFEPFNNTMCDSSLYLKTDGNSVCDLSDEIEGNPAVKSVTRSGNRIYYVDADAAVKVKIQDENSISAPVFYDESGNRIDGLLAETVIVLQNKIYGIRINAAGEQSGRLFSANLDGTGFKFLTDYDIYNLKEIKDYNDYYLFYCEAANRDTLHMVRVRTMDDYTLSITNHRRENLLSGVKQFVVNRNHIYYTSDSGELRIVDTGRVLQELEIVWLDEDAVHAVTQAENGDSLAYVDFMNFDDINNVLYVVKGNKVYYYTEKNRAFKLIYTADSDISDFSLFRNSAYQVLFCGKSGNVQFEKATSYSDGNVSIN